MKSMTIVRTVGREVVSGVRFLVACAIIIASIASAVLVYDDLIPDSWRPTPPEVSAQDIINARRN
jgi:hypothetical protein